MKFYRVAVWIVSLSGACVVSFGDTHYVSTSGSNTAPFDTWGKAARTIQAAVDEAEEGDTVLVNDGVYDQHVAHPHSSFPQPRVDILQPIRLESVNGPGVTIIQGLAPTNWVGTIDLGAIRGVSMVEGSELIGFTIQDAYSDQGSGAGVRVEGSGISLYNAFVSNCVIRECHSIDGKWGGGASGGTYVDCVFSNNSAETGGAVLRVHALSCKFLDNVAAGGGGGGRESSFTNCVFYGNQARSGGGTYQSEMVGCELVSNRATDEGGGAWQPQSAIDCVFSSNISEERGGGIFKGRNVNNSFFAGNVALLEGGALYNTAVRNCTLTGNRAALGGGLFIGSAINSIVYHNVADDGPNYYGSGLTYSCATPLPMGVGNVDVDPQVVSLTNPHLLSSSPCRNAGLNSGLLVNDFEGDPRILEGAIDMGVDEFIERPQTGSLDVAIVAINPTTVVGFPLILEGGVTGAVRTLEWSFGDGTMVSNEFKSAHVYSAPGTYTAVVYCVE